MKKIKNILNSTHIFFFICCFFPHNFCYSFHPSDCWSERSMRSSFREIPSREAKTILSRKIRIFCWDFLFLPFVYFLMTGCLVSRGYVASLLSWRGFSDKPDTDNFELLTLDFIENYYSISLDTKS